MKLGFLSLGQTQQVLFVSYPWINIVHDTKWSKDEGKIKLLILFLQLTQVAYFGESLVLWSSSYYMYLATLWFMLRRK